MTTRRWFAGAVALVGLLAGCSDPQAAPAGPTPAPSASAVPADPAATAPAEATPITCSTFYRVNDTRSPKDGPVLTFTEPEQTETARFEELTFTGSHSNDEFEGRSLTVSVSEKGRKIPLFRQLFQMGQDEAPDNIFGTTGQGFTGLMYVYSASGAELQFICESG